MSQSIRRVLAVTGLVAALLLSSRRRPGPRGCGSRCPPPVSLTRAWSWLESLLGTSGPLVSTQRPAMQQKDTDPDDPRPAAGHHVARGA